MKLRMENRSKFFVLAAENAKIGVSTWINRNIGSYADSPPVIWLPLLGESKKPHLEIKGLDIVCLNSIIRI